MMPSKPTAPIGRVPARQDIEGVIVSELAAAQQRPVAEVRTTLVAAGADMPLDSLETVEIMLALEEAFGIRFPESPETCAAFQSVRALSDLVQQLAGETGD
jgi:acyl carrier protein